MTTIKVVPVENEPMHRTVFRNDQVRVYYVTIPPGAATLLHHHAHPYITVAIGEAEFSNEVEGKPPKAVRLKDGETMEGGGGYAHVIRNLGRKAFVNVTIEFLKDAPSGGKS